MTTLADRIEAGTATREDVAVALGWRVQHGVKSAGRDRWTHWHKHPIPTVIEWASAPPDYRHDLNALVAECERLGLYWTKTAPDVVPSPSRPFEMFVAGEYALGVRKEGAAYSDGTPQGDTLALCAALVRAVEAGHG